ncbi:PLP-dependent aspartate aminotransferase family protein [Bacillus sp. 03113]|uniref:trans-sulfuration enzyme family protein n=1 Tax=Bacillus sp. 03113 TaxID=2578211 RepID=UPI0015E8CAAC|nr:aminotransferase class I/II-fold pyridoxal phosphate-dependent enzyme [Bacillus sp. 03113]
MEDMTFSRASELLYRGKKVKGMDLKPEATPLFLTTAFTMDSLSEVKDTYAEKGYTYIRTCNPNRDMLADAVSYLEGGEKSLIFSSGMAAITTTLMTVLKPGDHIICNSDIYGETFDVMTILMKKFGVESDLVDLSCLETVQKTVKPNTKMIYTEVMSNPTMALADLEGLAEIAHANGGYLMVDNTFTTPLAIQPIACGADIVINSLTKYVNGHSDAIGGSITASEKIIDEIHPIRMLCGTPGDPFSSWMILRGLHTIELRVPKQMETAAKLAKALEDNPFISKVNHPSLESFPQHELAKRMFTDKGYSGMLSFVVPEDMEKIDAFMKKLNFAHYAPTLGGLRTTLNHTVTSSHSHVPDDIRRQMGITPGMFRLSVGIEDADDLIADFTQALEVFREVKVTV